MSDKKFLNNVATAIEQDNLLTIKNLNVFKNNIVQRTILKMNNGVKKVNLTATGLHQRINNVFDGLDDDDIIKISKHLKTNTKLTNLILNVNKIGVAGAQALSEALLTNTTLMELHLSNNQIGDAGAIVLANALQAPNSSLEVLMLESNNIGAEGAIAIADALQFSRDHGVKGGLKMLDLSLNHIGDAGAKALAKILDESQLKQSQHGLVDLILRNNNIGPDGAIALATALKTNSSLEGLDLFGNHIQDTGAIAFSDCIKYNSTLDDFDLRYNDIGPIGVNYVYYALKEFNTKMTNLLIRQKDTHEDILKRIDEILEANASDKIQNMVGSFSSNQKKQKVEEIIEPHFKKQRIMNLNDE